MPRPKRQFKHLVMVRSKLRQAINPAADADSENDTDNEIIVVPEETLDDSAVNRAYDHVLRWVDGARPKRPAVYHGTSERTKFRRQKNRKQYTKQLKAPYKSVSAGAPLYSMEFSAIMSPIKNPWSFNNGSVRPL